jgi:hypothetical protein
MGRAAVPDQVHNQNDPSHQAPEHEDRDDQQNDHFGSADAKHRKLPSQYVVAAAVVKAGLIVP